MFGGRRPLRPILGTQATSQVAREVRTEDELRAALQPLDTNSSNVKRVIIAAPITIKTPIEISKLMEGVTIESHGMFPLYPGGASIIAFINRAPNVTFLGLRFVQDPVNLTNMFELPFLIEVEDSSQPPINMVVDRCVSVSTNFLSDDSAGLATGINIFQCVHVPNIFSGSGEPDSDSIVIDSPCFFVSMCSIDACGTGNAIRLGANAENVVIVGNCLHGSPISTSVSLGSNFIVGNTDTGTLTTHATDVVLQTTPSGGGGTFGQTTATFSGGADAVTVTVVDAGVTAGSNIIPTIAMGARDADEMEMAPVVVAVGSITAGVGFTLIVVSLDGDAEGAYLINYTRD